MEGLARVASILQKLQQLSELYSDAFRLLGGLTGALTVMVQFTDKRVGDGSWSRLDTAVAANLAGTLAKIEAKIEDLLRLVQRRWGALEVGKLYILVAPCFGPYGSRGMLKALGALEGDLNASMKFLELNMLANGVQSLDGLASGQAAGACVLDQVPAGPARDFWVACFGVRRSRVPAAEVAEALFAAASGAGAGPVSAGRLDAAAAPEFSARALWKSARHGRAASGRQGRAAASGLTSEPPELRELWGLPSQEHDLRLLCSYVATGVARLQGEVSATRFCAAVSQCGGEGGGEGGGKGGGKGGGHDAASSRVGAVLMWLSSEAKTGALLTVTSVAHTAAVTGLRVEGGTAMTVSLDRTGRLYSIKEAGFPLLRGVLVGHEDALTCCSMDKRQKLAYTGSADRTLRAWMLGSGQCVAVYRHEYAVTQVECCAEAGTVAYCTLNPLLDVVVRRGGEVMARIAANPGTGGTCLAWWPRASAEQRLATVGGDRCLRLWDIATEELACSFRADGAPSARHTLVTAAGTLMTFGSRGQVYRRPPPCAGLEAGLEAGLVWASDEAREVDFVHACAGPGDSALVLLRERRGGGGGGLPRRRSWEYSVALIAGRAASPDKHSPAPLPVPCCQHDDDGGDAPVRAEFCAATGHLYVAMTSGALLFLPLRTIMRPPGPPPAQAAPLAPVGGGGRLLGGGRLVGGGMFLAALAEPGSPTDARSSCKPFVTRCTLNEVSAVSRAGSNTVALVSADGKMKNIMTVVGYRVLSVCAVHSKRRVLVSCEPVSCGGKAPATGQVFTFCAETGLLLHSEATPAPAGHVSRARLLLARSAGDEVFGVVGLLQRRMSVELPSGSPGSPGSPGASSSGHTSPHSAAAADSCELAGGAPMLARLSLTGVVGAPPSAGQPAYSRIARVARQLDATSDHDPVVSLAASEAALVWLDGTPTAGCAEGRAGMTGRDSRDSSFTRLRSPSICVLDIDRNAFMPSIDCAELAKDCEPPSWISGTPSGFASIHGGVDVFLWDFPAGIALPPVCRRVALHPGIVDEIRVDGNVLFAALRDGFILRKRLHAAEDPDGEADAAVDRVCMHRPGRIAVAIVPGGRKGITLGRDGYIAFPQF